MARRKNNGKRFGLIGTVVMIVAAALAIYQFVPGVKDALTQGYATPTRVYSTAEISDTGFIEVNGEQIAVDTSGFYTLETIPAYHGVAAVAINGGEPFFTEAEVTTESFESYSNLDELGRCGVASSCVGKDIMPTATRGSIGMVKPSGWHLVKYDCVDGKYLYNRCHLIGFQLTGENANKGNLITGTRYLNVQGMLPWENAVTGFVKETGYHVMYRVTPIFTEDNLLADGVLIEGLSVEDGGESVTFCIYCYNVQPGVWIDYATGESHLE